MHGRMYQSWCRLLHPHSAPIFPSSLILPALEVLGTLLKLDISV